MIMLKDNGGRRNEDIETLIKDLGKNEYTNCNQSRLLAVAIAVEGLSGFL